MAPYVDDLEDPKYLYLYHFTFSVDRYHAKSSKESVYGLVAASSEKDAEARIRNIIIDKHLAKVTGAVKATSVDRVVIRALDMDEIASPLRRVGDAYVQEVLRLVKML